MVHWYSRVSILNMSPVTYTYIAVHHITTVHYVPTCYNIVLWAVWDSLLPLRSVRFSVDTQFKVIILYMRDYNSSFSTAAVCYLCNDTQKTFPPLSPPPSGSEQTPLTAYCLYNHTPRRQIRMNTVSLSRFFIQKY